LRWRLNEYSDVESLIDMGIEFQMWGAAKEKARLPIERFVLKNTNRKPFQLGLQSYLE